MERFESKTVVVWYNVELNSVCINWKDQARSRTVRSAFNRAYEILLKNRAANWIIDTEHLGPINTTDQQWISKMVPHAIAQGLEKVAILLPPTLVIRHSLESLETALIKKHLLVEDFVEKEALYQWIRNAPLSMQ